MRNIFLCSRAGSLGRINGAALGMMLAVLLPGKLAADLHHFLQCFTGNRDVQLEPQPFW